MENKKIITILLVIIVILCACLGIMFYQMTNAKQPTKLKITSNKTLYEGDSLSVKLTDKNKKVISSRCLESFKQYTVEQMAQNYLSAYLDN